MVRERARRSADLGTTTEPCHDAEVVSTPLARGLDPVHVQVSSASRRLMSQTGCPVPPSAQIALTASTLLLGNCRENSAGEISRVRFGSPFCSFVIHPSRPRASTLPSTGAAAVFSMITRRHVPGRSDLRSSMILTQEPLFILAASASTRATSADLSGTGTRVQCQSLPSMTG